MIDRLKASAAYEAVLKHEGRALALRTIGQSGRQNAVEERGYAANSLTVTRALLAGVTFRVEARNAAA